MSDDEIKPANWEHWKDMLSAEVWQLVALSLNIEPDSLPVDWRPADYSDPFVECPSEFRRRLKIALNHIQNGMLLCASLALGNSLASTIKLTVFATWASAPSPNWSLPKEFRLPSSGARTGYENQTLAASSSPNRSAANQLSPAPRLKVDEAISAVYDEAQARGEKPPNLAELVAPVKLKLKQQGLGAAKTKIQEIADDPKHADRRGDIGVTLKSKKT